MPLCSVASLDLDFCIIFVVKKLFRLLSILPDKDDLTFQNSFLSSHENKQIILVVLNQIDKLTLLNILPKSKRRISNLHIHYS